MTPVSISDRLRFDALILSGRPYSLSCAYDLALRGHSKKPEHDCLNISDSPRGRLFAQRRPTRRARPHRSSVFAAAGCHCGSPIEKYVNTRSRYLAITLTALGFCESPTVVGLHGWPIRTYHNNQRRQSEMQNQSASMKKTPGQLLYAAGWDV